MTDNNRCAGVFDDRCPKIELDYGVQEGTCFDLGALAYSGHGDGGYEVYTGRLGAHMAKIRIAFDDAARRDRAISIATSGRAYSARVRFKIGEAIACWLRATSVHAAHQPTAW